MTDYRLKNRWQVWFPSELERREAARFAGITWTEFEELPGTRAVAEQLELSNSKCDVVAHYRMSRLYEAVLYDLQRKYPEQKA